MPLIGIVLGMDKRTLRSSMDKFTDELIGSISVGFNIIDRDQMITHSMLSPATCCLVNPDSVRTVEQSVADVNRMADRLKDTYLPQFRLENES